MTARSPNVAERICARNNAAVRRASLSIVTLLLDRRRASCVPLGGSRQTEIIPLRTISTQTAEHYTWGGLCDGWFLLKGDAVHVIQERMPPGAAEVMHWHRRSSQFFYVLRGTLTMFTATSSATISPGQGVVVEPEVHHRVTNDSSADVDFLVISCPPSHGDRVNCEPQPTAG